MCRKGGKQARNFAILGEGGENMDNDEIGLTSANQFKIGWDLGDLGTRAGGPRANVPSSSGRTDRKLRRLGYQQAVSAAETELL